MYILMYNYLALRQRFDCVNPNISKIAGAGADTPKVSIPNGAWAYFHQPLIPTKKKEEFI
jgi:hypothetical protein